MQDRYGNEHSTISEKAFGHYCDGLDLFLAAQPGGIEQLELAVREDDGYAVAWEPTLEYRLTRARKIRSFLFGDQILLRFSGRGRLWVQSRSPHALANFCHPFRRVQSNNNN